jgi:type IV pilus assembly protein PilY1
MKTILSLLGFLLALLGADASADVISIAQVPLLNINGTGNVKPNVMLLYDNSGSMSSHFTPDYIDDTTTCRAGATMQNTITSNGTRACSVGQPPFNSADFNRQYYDPKVRYVPPVDDKGNSYQSMNRSFTSDWTSVTTDGFGVNRKDLLGAGSNATNLAAGFPDLKWCDTGKNNCVYNTATYSYPNDVRYTAVAYSGNPYYYTINVAEWCTSVNLTTCKQTGVGEAAPAGYPFPAKVRWCSDKALTTCQAKYVGDYKYPRFGNPNGAVVAGYGTITIGASTGDTRLNVNSVSVAEPGGAVVITNGAVTASGGTNSNSERTALATAVAASINAKNGLVNQYAACVNTPALGYGVAACSSYGITLAGNNVVAVIPIDCLSGASGKSTSTCSTVADGSRSGWAVSADVDSALTDSTDMPTALVTVSGSTGPNTTISSGTRLGDTLLLNNSVTLYSRDSASVVSRLVGSIGTVGSITAYIGGNRVTDVCARATTSTMCLVDSGSLTGGKTVTMGGLNSNTKGLSFATTPTSAPGAGAVDTIPVSTTPLGAGAAIFVRTDIVASVTSYPKAAGRTDCSGATTCSYDEEMTNFANWYAYYKSRNQMMKTAVGQAFQSLSVNYNVGIVALSVAAAEGAMTTPREFSSNNRADWYSRLYAMNGDQSTPIRQALHAIGKMYANQAPYNYAAKSAAVQYPCQQNYTFITTDGYWNGGAADTVVNNDNVESTARFCTRASGCLDATAQTSNSLADVALYWYNGGSNSAIASLRTDLEDWKNPGMVPAISGDNQRLHMNTFALGLGVDGVMNYEPNYDTKPTPGGDFFNLKTGVTKGCPWNSNNAYVWPDPKTADSSGSAAYQSRVDDLWHAAINGHGKYFSASDPTQVVHSLGTALLAIQVRRGAASAAATSTPNISQEDNDIFSSTFTTVKWYGELSDRKIDVATGVVGDTVSWTSSNIAGLKVSDAADTRTILMLDTTNTTLKRFDYATMSALERGWFDNKCNLLSQCAGLSADNQKIVNTGANIVNWLRGQQGYADDNVLRAYSRTEKTPAGASGPLPIVIGDIASSKPAYLREPRKGYTNAGYSDFKAAQATRAPAVFVAANDGMLHAFNAKTGEELWAYVPRITMKKLAAQASVTYGLNHQFTTDGAPEVGDVKIGANFRSVLVAGFNAGGRGFYALDVTTPGDPKALWELCADASLCSNYDADLGLSFGNPQFGTWRDATGTERWVVFLTSGYNNVPGTDGGSGGDGKGYLYVVDAATGRVLNKTSTGNGSVGTPSGFARITAISADPMTDPMVTYIYGGDNQGKMYRFDYTGGGTPLVVQMGDAGSAQPITTRPEVTMCEAATTTTTTTGTTTTTTPASGKVVIFGTGRLLDVSDIADVGKQSLYVLKDRGTAIVASDWRKASVMSQQTLTLTDAGNFTIGGGVVNLASQAGWFLDVDKQRGERINLDPKVVAGTLNVVTNIPTASDACSVGGKSNLYQLNVCTGKPLLTDPTDGLVAGRQLSTSSAAVGFIIVRLPSGALKLVATTADGGNKTMELPPATTQAARKTGWRRVRD